MERILKSGLFMALLLLMLVAGSAAASPSCSLSISGTAIDAVDVTLAGTGLGSGNHPFIMNFGDGSISPLTLTGDTDTEALSHLYTSGSYRLHAGSSQPMVYCTAYVCRFRNVTKYSACASIGVQYALDVRYEVWWSRNPIASCPSDYPLIKFCSGAETCSKFTDWVSADSGHTYPCNFASLDNNPPYTTCVRDSDKDGLYDFMCLDGKIFPTVGI